MKRTTRPKRSAALTALLWLLASCAAPAAERAQGDEVIGAPPSRDQDPFAPFVLPADARPAPSSGTIGAAIPDEPPPEERPSRPGCYACIRICPDGVDPEECAERGGDLICGWGSAEDAAVAKERAQAECEAALAMARKMGTYRAIEGACPQASCSVAGS